MKKALWICLIVVEIVMVISLVTIFKEKDDYYQNVLNSGYEYLNEYDYENAKACFDYAIELNKGEAVAYLGQGQILLKQGRCEECITYLDQLLSEKPAIENEGLYYYIRGTALFELQQYDLAVGFFEQACEMDEDNADYKRDAAVCYAKLGDTTKAKELLGTVQPDDISKYIEGQVAFSEGNTDLAIACFEEVITLTTDENLKTRAYLELSYVYKSLRHTDTENWTAIKSQIDVLERAVKDLKDEDNLIITEAMAEVYFTAKEYDLSIQKFKRLLELGYDRAYIYRNIAIIYQQTNDLENAETYLIMMQEKYPTDYQCYVQFAYLYTDMEGRKAENERDYTKVKENYELAITYAPDGENTSEIMQLSALISELEEKGWL